MVEDGLMANDHCMLKAVVWCCVATAPDAVVRALALLTGGDKVEGQRKGCRTSVISMSEGLI